MKLFKTTIVIWSDYNPAGTELEDLARDSQSGDSYCSQQSTVFVDKLDDDPDWDGTEFFGIEDEEEENLRDEKRGLYGQHEDIAN